MFWSKYKYQPPPLLPFPYNKTQFESVLTLNIEFNSPIMDRTIRIVVRIKSEFWIIFSIYLQELKIREGMRGSADNLHIAYIVIGNMWISSYSH